MVHMTSLPFTIEYKHTFTQTDCLSLSMQGRIQPTSRGGAKKSSTYYGDTTVLL